ncbi:MAG: hypothetical protein K8T20_04265, partial [Planctomycetes bacterium]|nr:hypothetical protein [Planctomycetota bacterium]
MSTKVLTWEAEEGLIAAGRIADFIERALLAADRAVLSGQPKSASSARSPKARGTRNLWIDNPMNQDAVGVARIGPRRARGRPYENQAEWSGEGRMGQG